MISQVWEACRAVEKGLTCQDYPFDAEQQVKLNHRLSGNKWSGKENTMPVKACLEARKVCLAGKDKQPEVGMRYLAGADGCRKGWVVVSRDLDTGQLDWQVWEKIHDFFSRDQPLAMGIDIPIGLPEAGARPCDLQARRLLGSGRGSSVFPAPIRSLLEAEDYPQACRIRQEVEGKKISKQTWNIIPKIREVDRLLRENPSLQNRVREVHPEVCFTFMTGGRPLLEGKRTKAGQAARFNLLSAHFGEIVAAAVEGRDRQACAADDVLDAFAALWTAERIFRGEAVSLPEEPPQDRTGLRMEIVA